MRAGLGLREETRRGRKRARARGCRAGDDVTGPKSGREICLQTLSDLWLDFLDFPG